MSTFTITTHSGSTYLIDDTGFVLDVQKGAYTGKGRGYQLSVNQGDVVVGKSMRISQYDAVDEEGYHRVIDTSNVKHISVWYQTADPHTLRRDKPTGKWIPVYDGKAAGSLMAEIIGQAARP